MPREKENSTDALCFQFDATMDGRHSSTSSRTERSSSLLQSLDTLSIFQHVIRHAGHLVSAEHRELRLSTEFLSTLQHDRRRNQSRVFVKHRMERDVSSKDLLWFLLLGYESRHQCSSIVGVPLSCQCRYLSVTRIQQWLSILAAVFLLWTIWIFYLKLIASPQNGLFDACLCHETDSVCLF